MAFFSSSENFKKFIATLIKEKVSLYKLDNFNDFVIEKNTNKNSSLIKGDIYVEKSKYLGEKLTNLDLNADFSNGDSPVIIEIKKTIGSEASIIKSLKRFKRVLSLNLILVTETKLTKKQKSNLYNEYPCLAIWDNSVVEKLINANRIIYLKTLDSKEIYRNPIISNISEADLANQKINLINKLKLLSMDPSFAIVLGAGVSCSEGAETWDQLLRTIKRKLELKLGVNSLSDGLPTTTGNTTLAIAQLYKETLSTREYFDTIYSSIYASPPIPSHTNTLAKVVADLIINNNDRRDFRVMSYNYDNYIELYLNDRMRYESVFNKNYNRCGKFPIYHVHGFMPYGYRENSNSEEYENSIILTEGEYNNLYNDAYKWQIGIQLSFFRENRCLFIGSSLQDPNFRRLLRMATDEKGNGTPNHFAIVYNQNNRLSGSELNIAINYFFNMGIEIIWTDERDEIRNIVETLSRQ